MNEEREKFVLDMFKDKVLPNTLDCSTDSLIEDTKKLFEYLDENKKQEQMFSDLYCDSCFITEKIGVSHSTFSKMRKQNNFPKYDLVRGSTKYWLRENISELLLELMHKDL